jgi:hypothetical protein
MELIEEVKKLVKLEIRMDSKEYLEVVVPRKDLERLQLILNRHLGPAAKEAGKKATFPKNVQNLVDSLGGLRIEQSFYYRETGTQLIFAALWPWESNPEKITLKAGMTEV